MNLESRCERCGGHGVVANASITFAGSCQAKYKVKALCLSCVFLAESFLAALSPTVETKKPSFYLDSHSINLETMHYEVRCSAVGVPVVRFHEYKDAAAVRDLLVAGESASFLRYAAEGASDVLGTWYVRDMVGGDVASSFWTGRDAKNNALLATDKLNCTGLYTINPCRTPKVSEPRYQTRDSAFDPNYARVKDCGCAEEASWKV